jgi:hypothetical protein
MLLTGGRNSGGLQSDYYSFTLKMATAVFAETLDISQHSTEFNPKA